ncbi:MAG TPA: DNA translocase FtsK 4TM domain-containing protein [Phycisphaerae bacterium]|nr:DNA translocase FtsK 4TM domain-containing protein [Phycisphaerae bacterium]
MDEPADAPATTLRNCRHIALLVFCAFAWVAILTFDNGDWPNTAVWPQPDPVHNGCGRAGAWISFQLMHYLGEGTFPLLLVLTFGALLQLARRPITGVVLRLIGLALLTSATAASSALMDVRLAGGLVEGRGGILGIALAAVLKTGFSTWGAWLVLIAAHIVGLLLTADDLLVRAPQGANWLRRKFSDLIEALRSAGTAGPTLTPVMMGAGNVAVASPPSRKRSEPAREEAVRTEEVEDEELDGIESAGGLEAELESVPVDDPATLPERELIIKMLGRDRVEGKAPKSAWPTELGDYVLPPLSLLRDPEGRYSAAQEGLVRDQAAILQRTLAEFRIEVQVVEIDTGPVITMFELELSAGTKVSQIQHLANDIARALKAPAVRVVAPIPGKHTIGIEVPNVNKEKVRLKELIMLGGVKPTRMALPVFIGKNASGDPLICDIATMPHMLIAGTTGSGKSVSINTLVMSILMTQRPDHVKLILVDPKMVELSVFKEIPHLMCPIVTDMQRAEMILQWATTKMDERYELLAEAGVRDIANFNRLGKEEIYNRFQPSTEEEKRQIPTHLPYILILIDELADLMMTSGKEVEHHLSRLAQKSRAVGIHLVVATQRPQANVVTGLVKSNLPCRVAFRVASRMDSRIVLDQNGAEVLMGEGDMLFLPPGSAKLVRAQGTYIEDDELRAVIKDLAAKARPEFHHELQRLKPDGDESSGERDPLFDRAVSIIVETKRGSVSLLQRRLEVGYSRASRLIDQMAAAGIVGEYKGSQAREVLITDKEWGAIRKQRDGEVSGGNYRADMEAHDDDRYGSADLDEGVPDLIDDRSDIRG